MIDYILHKIEKISGFLFNWAWDQRFKNRDPNEWLKEYKEWKKN